MVNSVENKNILITGSSSGIGEATAILFKEKGWFVIGVDITSDENNICDLFIKHNLSEIENIGDIKNKLAGEGINRIDALINNAAVQITSKIEDVSLVNWNKTLNTNLLAPFFLIQKLLPLLKKDGASIVNVSSIHSKLTKKYFTLYATSKGALETMTKSLALELAPKIRVNAVLPAATDTKMLRDGFANNLEGYNKLALCHPIERVAKPDEVAKVIHFLCSDSSSFITGTSIDINGGIGVLLHDPAGTPSSSDRENAFISR